MNKLELFLSVLQVLFCKEIIFAPGIDSIKLSACNEMKFAEIKALGPRFNLSEVSIT